MLDAYCQPAVFTVDFGHGQGEVELCDGGSDKVLTNDNIDEFTKLYLKKYTELDAL